MYDSIHYFILKLSYKFTKKVYQKNKWIIKNTPELEFNPLAQESSSSSSFFALASLGNIFFFTSYLLSLLVNFVYLSLIQICIFLSTLLTGFFISNNHRTAFFFTQFRLSWNFHSGIEAIFSLILRVTNCLVLLSSIKTI